MLVARGLLLVSGCSLLGATSKRHLEENMTSEKIRSYRDLQTWKMVRELAVPIQIFDLCAGLL